jgi:pheromone shutdown-related protein TraB
LLKTGWKEKLLKTRVNNSDVHYLSFEDKEVILLGTAHVSRESAQLVASVIDEEKPDTVCIELCKARYQSIRQKDRWRDTNIIKVIKEKKAFLLLSNLLLASFQKRIANKLDIKPGAEIIQAIESGEATGSEIYLADREIRITMSRTWRIMSMWDKIKLVAQVLMSAGEIDDVTEKEIEEIKQGDMLETLLADIGESLPAIRNILIDERDRYLAQKIRTAPGKKIVAVVGAGHVPGIKKYWEVNTDIKELEKIPPRSILFRSLQWILPFAVLSLFVLGFFYGGSKTGSEMIIWWVMANGLLAGLGATIALAHPFTVLSAVLAAPLTSLNPMIAAGWVSGLVEAFSRKPKVKDFESLSEDISSIKGFWKNKVTKILLVVVLTNLGSAIGTFIALPLMLKIL